jgi:hypothetical protein
VRALAALVASLWLPAGGTFSSVQPAGSALFLNGFADRGPGCIWATADPQRMRMLRTHRGSCASEARASGRLTPSIVYALRSPWQEVVLSNGSVVFRYQDFSDTKPVWTVGAGSLWIYDVNTDKGPEAVRVSLASGRIVQRTSMPKLYRPALAANEDGLWLTATTSGGVGGGPQPLLHVAPGARHAVVVHRGGRAALWILAHGHSVWMEQIAGTLHTSLWRFDGPSGSAHLLLPKADFIAAAAVWGAGSIWAAGTGVRCADEHVFRIDPATGRTTRVASVPTGSCEPLGGDPQGITFTGGAVYFLDPPWLHRIRP